MEIRLTNTLGRKKEVFKPIKPGQAGIYSCGLTVYNYAHIGNLRAYLFTDILKRMLMYNDYKVKHVMNITDVGHLESDEDQGEDKIEKEAKKEGKTSAEIAEYYTKAFFEDLKTMNILMPDITPKATEHIQDMIALNKRLEDGGFTYVSGGNLYFDTTRYPQYALLANLKLDEESTKTRAGKDPAKKTYSDFALWLTNHKYKSHEMQWDSPWGRGFPGWHIECSAMSTKYLGEHIDIHTGGIDHIPVHHTNEIAQSECAYGHKWVNYWLHNEFVVIDDEKMSKSKGNILRITNLVEAGVHPMEYRYFLLQTHYRKRIIFTMENLSHAQNAYKKLKNKIIEFNSAMPGTTDQQKMEEYRQAFLKEINDDLNLPNALSLLWKMTEEVISPASKLELLKEFDKVLGLCLFEIAEDIPEEILLLKEARDKARALNEWKKSDELREVLLEKGYEIRDDKNSSRLIKRR